MNKTLNIGTIYRLKQSDFTLLFMYVGNDKGFGFEVYPNGNAVYKEIHDMIKNELTPWVSVHEDEAYFRKFGTYMIKEYDFLYKNKSFETTIAGEELIFDHAKCTVTWHHNRGLHVSQDGVGADYVFEITALDEGIVPFIWARGFTMRKFHVCYFIDEKEHYSSGITIECEHIEDVFVAFKKLKPEVLSSKIKYIVSK